MKRFTTIEALRAEILKARLSGKRIGFVPTMGALHEGHLTLMREARGQNDIVIASVFVNPTQFNDKADLEKYPRDLEADEALMRQVPVDWVFAPTVDEMYPEPMETIVDVPKLSSGLIGKIRPGHFQGMASVVVKLLNIAGADNAYFGEKDYQQLAIIRRFTSDLNIPTKIHGVPIVREKDGLAMSSRNQRLTAEDRQASPVIYRSICHAQALVKSGIANVSELQKSVADFIANEPRAELLSADIVDAKTLEPIPVITTPAALLLNVRFGEIILIDQGILTPNA